MRVVINGVGSTTADRLIHSLQNPAIYTHAAGPFSVVETHISWVILTGPFAYKIKKPVNLGFLDFSTLAKRRFFCEEEVRTNQRLCPDVYIGVVPIRGDPSHPTFAGAGKPFEYAVKMKQFDDDLLWDRMSERGELKPELLDKLATLIARFHADAPPASLQRPYGLPSTFKKNLESTLEHLDRSIRASPDRKLYRGIRRWIESEYCKRAHRMIQRRHQGFVREVHGDLHLRNVALFSRNKPDILVFDGIEFDANLRWIDVINDIAFLIMDLQHRQLPHLSWRFVNAYLEITGDYKGLDLLPMYAASRALVRSMVLTIEAAERGHHEWPSEARAFLNLADVHALSSRPRLYITHGLSGSGKTTATKDLIEILSAIRLRSDIERKRLFGLRPNEASSTAQKESMYGQEGNRRTYQHLKDLSRHLLKAGYTVIVDAAFLKRSDRRAFQGLAIEANADFRILDFRAPEEILRQRVQERSEKGRDASEADLQVLTDQMRNREDIAVDERPYVVLVEPSRLREQFKTDNQRRNK